MSDLKLSFAPPRRTGLIIHASIAAGSLIIGGGLLFLAFDQPGRNLFLVWIILSLLILAPLPVLIYRGYALFRALYTIGRDSLRLHWGLRSEDIPIPQIEWIRPAAELGFHLPLPLLAFPGAILGNHSVEGLGPVEFLSSDIQTLTLIATPAKIYAISPANPGEFMKAYRMVSEMGSLSPSAPTSNRSVNFLSLVWSNKFLRTVYIASFWLTVLLFVLVNVVISQNASISLGFNPDGTRVPQGPSAQLILLPILSSFTFMVDLLAGMFIYHRKNRNILAYILSMSSLVTPILLIIATLFYL
jgi:hypothetical protein